MGEIEDGGPAGAGAAAAAALQRRRADRVDVDGGGAQYSVLCREDGGVLDDLFTYRLDADRYLTVTNAANHERDLAWFRAHAGDFPDAEVERPRSTTTRCSPCRARSRAGSCRRSPTRRCPRA